jgi:hypothetical protein
MKIMDAWTTAGRGVDDVNPVKKIVLLVSQRMDQLGIVPVNVAPDAVMGQETSQGGGEEVIQNL